MSIDDKIRHIREKADHAGQIRDRLHVELEHVAAILDDAERLAGQVPDPSRHGITPLVEITDGLSEGPVVTGLRPVVTGMATDETAPLSAIPDRDRPYARPGNLS